jgi:hypothetical protein
MHARFLESLQRRDLGMRQTRFGFALREGPASATPRSNATSRPNQEKLDAAIAYAVANRSRLFALPQFLQLRESNKISRPLYYRRKPGISRAPYSRTS